MTNPPQPSSANIRFFEQAARRLAFWGPVIVGILSLGVSIRAADDREYIVAGLCLLASVASFAVIGYFFGARKKHVAPTHFGVQYGAADGI
jgi:hypothetical protein